MSRSKSEAQAPRYHDAAYTLDEKIELPDDVDEQPLSAGHDEDDREQVRERIEQHKQEAKEAVQAQAERDREWAEREDKPRPSELLHERGVEPAPDDDEESSSRRRRSSKKNEDEKSASSKAKDSS